MRVFALKSCDTCRKALRALTDAGIAAQVVDVRADGIEAVDLAAIARHLGERSVNRASTTWRGLDEAARALPVADLLAAHPTVMKRPVIRDGDTWHVGWSADVRAAVLPGASET